MPLEKNETQTRHEASSAAVQPFSGSFAAELASCLVYVSFFYVAILAIFVFCYGRILAAIRRQARVMAGHSAAGSSRPADQTQSKQIQTNVIKTMIIVSVFYAVAYLPNYVYFLIVSIDLASSLSYGGSFYHVTAFIAFLYTAANPFIYATKFNPVKQVLRKMIPCQKNRVQPIDLPAETA